MAELRGEWSEPPTTALLVGSYVDSWFEGTLDNFKQDHPELFTAKGTLKADYVNAEKIIERISRDELFMKYMSGRKQVVRTGTIAGVPFKIKMDSYHKGKCIVDLKVIKSLDMIWDEDDGVKKDFIRYWGYDKQAAIYQEVEGNNLPFVLCVVTKEPEPDIAVIRIPQNWIDMAKLEIRSRAPYFDEIKRDNGVGAERCEQCSYCRRTKKLKRVIDATELFPDPFELFG
jgi:hypothetical protein